MHTAASRLASLVMSVAFLFVLVLVAGIYTTGIARADGPDWLNTAQNPTLVREWPYAPGSYNPVIVDNSGCENVTFNLSNSNTTTQCMVQVLSGQIGNGYYLPNGAKTGNTLSNSRLNGIPNTDEGYILTTDSHLALYPGISTHVQPNIGTGFQSYTVEPNSNQFTLADKSGATLSINPNTISFSSNGEWMVVQDTSANNAFVSVNLQTRDIIPFAPGTGAPNSTSTAISNDGRYAAIHDPSSGSQSFKIYDLSTCGAVPNHITTYISCSSRDIQSYVASAVPGYVNFQRIQFSTDNLLTIKVYGTDQSNNPTIFQYDVEAPGLVTGGLQYLGLGDSYSSGEGAAGDPNSASENTGPGGYIVGTDDDVTNEPVNLCHSSPESWPNLIADTLSYTSSDFRTVACSEARSKHVTDVAQYYPAPVDNNLGNWLPGLEPQYVHVGDELPKVMTLTTGGNDVGFGDIIATCVEEDLQGSDCYSYYEQRLALVDNINKQFSTWHKMYTQLIDDAGPGSTLYVIGYPQIVGSGGICAENVRLTANDIDFADKLTSYLNYVISQAAAFSGAKYIDTTSALSGHELCQGPGIAVNGLTLDRNGEPVSQGSYHPNAYGQQLLAQSILNSTSNFTVAAPAANTATAPPTDVDNSTAPQQLQNLLNAPHTNQPVSNIEVVHNGTDTFINNVFQKSGNITYSVNGIDYGLRPNTSYTLTMHSDPVTVGTFTTDANGNLNISTPVPSALGPGVHTMDISGLDLSGDTVDLADTAFVNASPTNLTATTPTSQAPVLSWAAASGATSYDIYRNGTLVGSSATNSYTDSSVAPGTYTYTVSAVFTAVESSDSNAVIVAYDNSLPTITNFTANNGTTFSRHDTPYSSGVATQAINSDGSLTVSVNNASGYADSGFYLYKTTLGNLPNFTVNSSSGDFGLNLWFDSANLGDFFQWDSNGNLTGLGGDTYGLSPGSTSGTLSVSGNTSFYMMDAGQNYTLSQLVAGDDTVSGINANTPVTIWVGVDVGSGGSAAATINAISGL